MTWVGITGFGWVDEIQIPAFAGMTEGCGNDGGEAQGERDIWRSATLVRCY